MGVWAAIASLYDLWMMYGTCSSCYRNVYVNLHQIVLGAKISFEKPKVCSTLWEDLGGRDDELGKQVAYLQSNEAWTEMPSISRLGNYCLLSSGRWKWCDWHKAPMRFGCFFCITNAIRKMTFDKYMGMFVCLPAPLWMVWILQQVCTLWRASRQSWENLPTSKASKKWCQQRPDIQFTGIRKTKRSIVMKLTLIGHDDHTSKPVLSYQFLTIHAAFFLHWNSSAQALAQSIPVLDISALYNGTKDKQRVIARRSVKQPAIEWVIFVSRKFLKMFNDFCSLIWRVTHHTSVKSKNWGRVGFTSFNRKAVWILWADWLCSGNRAWRGPRTHDEFEEQSAARFGKIRVDSRSNLRLKAALVLGSCCFIAG